MKLYDQNTEFNLVQCSDLFLLEVEYSGDGDVEKRKVHRVRSGAAGECRSTLQ